MHKMSGDLIIYVPQWSEENNPFQEPGCDASKGFRKQYSGITKQLPANASTSFCLISGRGRFPRFQGRHGNQGRPGEELDWLSVTCHIHHLLRVQSSPASSLFHWNGDFNLFSLRIFLRHRVRPACLGPVGRTVLRVLKAELGPTESRVPLVLLGKR